MYLLILRLIRGLEMAVFEPKIVFLAFWTLCVCLFVAKIVYSDSAHGELSFGTKTGSLRSLHSNFIAKFGSSG